MPCRIILNNNNKVPAKVIPPFILRISLFFFRKRQVPFVNKRVDVAKYVRNKTCKCCKLLFECRQSNCFSIRVMKGMQWRGVAVCLQNEEWWPTHRQLLLSSCLGEAMASLLYESHNLIEVEVPRRSI